jgi:tetratricopeptide (TPR) repeat protein
MLKRIVLLVFAVALLSTHALGQVDPPKLDPTPSTEKQSALIKEGVALHDQEKYDAAISKYEEALKENPANVSALYEMSFSYAMKKDYRKSLDVAYKGAQYRSKLLHGFYIQIGNNLDHLGETAKSIEVYKAGIKLSPQSSMLYYNLAVAYSNQNKLDDARKTLKQAIAYNPNHPSSHLFLSTIWRQGGYKVPALLSACRFLVLEPNSGRSAAALKVVQEVMGGNVTAGKKPNEINVFVDMSGKKDEGDFDVVALILGMGKAAGLTEENKNKTEMQLLAEQFGTLFAIMSEQSDKSDKSKFTWKFYVPYFGEMKRKNYVEPFVYYVNQSSGNAEVQTWLTNNKARVNEFLAWSKSYPWPKAE